MGETIIVKKRTSGVSRAAGAQNYVKFMEGGMNPRKGYERSSKDRSALFTLMPETHPGNPFHHHSLSAFIY